MYSKAQTADAISALGLLRPTEALVLSPGASFVAATSEYSFKRDLEKGVFEWEDVSSTNHGFKVEKIDSNLLEVGDIVRIQTGATPPADATIVSGTDGAFDESSLTGESRLVKKSVGDQVFLGTINKGKIVDAKVDACGGTTMLDHIVKVVQEGQTRRAPIERVADLLTGYFVPIVTLLAIITWVTWLSLGLSGVLPRDYLDISIGGWTVWSVEFAISVFVVSCPCGLGLAAPTALLVGSGLAAKFGILAQGGGEAFQEMAQVDVVFDKTGTLTEGGEPTVSDSEVVSVSKRWERGVVLGIAAEMESASSHPLGTAIRSFCVTQGASPSSGSLFEETAGRGLKAHFEDLQCTAIIGNEAWLEEHGVTVDDVIRQRLGTWKAEAKSVVLLAIRDESGDSADSGAFATAAIFAVADRLRPEAQSVVAYLQHQGISTWMISGDNAVTARAVAKTVGIPTTNVIAGVLPHEKAQKIQWLQQVGAKRTRSKWGSIFAKRRLNARCIVAMVGDGINDAPALTTADISVAIGSGSDVAISSASFILLSSDLRSLLTLNDLSRKVFNRVKCNLFYAGIYNVIAIPIAAGVIYPAGHARLAPVWASLIVALSSVSVVCSSLLLKLYKEPKTVLTRA
ncbi:heavy metal translocatin [Tricholoma matsutake]|nr:heavy metal translocatin [Tricholoma matsutake 945]